MADKLLTSEQVAEILQVHPFTVLKYIKNGSLKAIKLGRVWRIRERDIDTFLEERSMVLYPPSETKPPSDRQKEPEIQTTETDFEIEDTESDHYIID